MRILIMLLVFISLNTKAQPTKVHPESKAIKEVLLKQQKHWNNGHIDSFMNGYWKSPQLRFVSKRGVSYGWQQVRDNYHRSYPNPEKMGKLQFNFESVESLGPDKALVIGSWEVNNEDGRLTGWFSLIFQKIKGKWLIIVDHTS